MTTVSHDSSVKLYETRVVLTVYQFSVLKISCLKKKAAHPAFTFSVYSLGMGMSFRNLILIWDSVCASYIDDEIISVQS